MLKIKYEKNQIETAFIESPGIAKICKMDHFAIKMFRVDLSPEPIIEITLARTDNAGNEHGPVTQFCIRGNQARQVMDMNVFDKFVEHLEDIAVAKSPIKCAKE